MRNKMIFVPMKQLPRQTKLALSFFALSLLSNCAFAPWETTVVKGNSPEEKINNVNEEMRTKPEQTTVRKKARVVEEKEISQLLSEANQAFDSGNLTEAKTLYSRVIKIEPSNTRALAGIKAIESADQHHAEIDEIKAFISAGKINIAQAKLHDILLENPNQTEALALQKELRKKSNPFNIAPPTLKPPFDKPVTLELRDANIRMVFEALSRSTGINFILDKDIRPETKATAFIKKARIEDAIDLVLSTNGLQKKVLSDTTALVYPNTIQKNKEYQDLVIRSFYLINSSAKQIATLLRTMIRTKDIYVDERLNTITMRDTPEAIRLAEKLVAANDMADPEVMLEIEVLEISRNRLQQLGIEYPEKIAINSLIPVTTVTTSAGVAVASSTVNTETPLTIAGLKNLNSSRFDVFPNPSINFKKTTGDLNLLANPRIRVRNNEKAKILVGDKVPIVTTVATAGVGSSQSVQYIDVGLKLDVEPRISLDDFVNIKIGLEVSSLGDSTQISGGGIVYRIGTRNASTLLRLKDGETQILAGLISDDERKSASKLPGLGDIPLLGRLFSNQQDQKLKTEIVLAITPRILNNIQRPSSEISEYWSGTENGISDHSLTVVPVNAGLDTNFERSLSQPQADTEPKDDKSLPETQPNVIDAVAPIPLDTPAKSTEQPKPAHDAVDPTAGF